MNPADSAYPLQTAGVVSQAGARIENTFAGGMTRRELIAAMSLQGLLANPALSGVQNKSTFLQLAFGMADAFLLKSATGASEVSELATVTPISPDPKNIS